MVTGSLWYGELQAEREGVTKGHGRECGTCVLNLEP